MANPPTTAVAFGLTPTASPLGATYKLLQTAAAASSQSVAMTAAGDRTFTPSSGTPATGLPDAWLGRGWNITEALLTPTDTRGRAYLPLQNLTVTAAITSTASNGLAVGNGTCALAVALWLVDPANVNNREFRGSNKGTAVATRGLGSGNPSVTVGLPKSYIPRGWVVLLSIGGTFTAPQPTVGSSTETYTFQNVGTTISFQLGIRSSFAIPLDPAVALGAADVKRRVAFDRSGDQPVEPTAGSARRVTTQRRLGASVAPDLFQTVARQTHVGRALAETTTVAEDTLRTLAYTRRIERALAAILATTTRAVEASRAGAEAVAALGGAARRMTAVRRLGVEEPSVAQAAAAKTATYPRFASEAVTIVDNPVRVTSIMRQLAEALDLDHATERLIVYRRVQNLTVAVVPNVVRQVHYPRQLTHDAEAAGEPIRDVEFLRGTFDAVAAVITLALRSGLSYRRVVGEIQHINASAARLYTAGRSARQFLQPGEDPVIEPTRKIHVVVRNADGTPHGAGALVVLFRDDTNFPVQTGTTGVASEVIFPRNSFDAATYFVAAWDTDGTPLATQAVSERGLVPEDV